MSNSFKNTIGTNIFVLKEVDISNTVCQYLFLLQEFDISNTVVTTTTKFFIFFVTL